MAPDVAAGWYPDPQGGGGQRYWDGAAWTEHVQPGAEAAPPPPPPPPPAGGADVAQAAAISQADAGGYTRGSLEVVPEHGRERIEQNRRGLFTSFLSVN